MTRAAELHELFVLTPGNVDSCFKAAKEGDKRAQLCMHVFSGSIEMLKTGTAPCLCCTSEFGQSNMPAVFVILLPVFPEADGQDMVVVTGMCVTCARRGKIRERAVEHLKRMLGEDCVIRVSVH